ncbi:MAG: hypothetical protein K6A38_07300 [Lachnospiraceae bacterium]|nr:hypothetical protein [Lachnospiraceae bacterium]
MAWCPKCKYEYREGITVCADCGCELVEDLSLILDKKEEEPFVYENIDPKYINPDEESFEFEYDEDESEEDNEPAEPYINKEEQAEDNKSSAWTLLIVGFGGLAAVVCFFLKIIPNDMTDSGRYMISGVMGVLFFLFIIMGFVALRNSRLFMKEAYTENNLTETIKKWVIANTDKLSVDEKLGFTDETEELRYFGRIKELKQMVNNQYMNLDSSYVDRVIEEVYPDIFEKKEF